MKIKIAGGGEADLTDVVGMKKNGFNIGDPNAEIRLKDGSVEYSTQPWDELISALAKPERGPPTNNPCAEIPMSSVITPHGAMTLARLVGEVMRLSLDYPNGMRSLTSYGHISLDGDAWEYSFRVLGNIPHRPGLEYELVFRSTRTNDQFQFRSDM